MAPIKLSYDRFAVAIVSLLTLLAVASLVRAALGPEITVRDAVILSAPYEDVWEFITETDKRILWETGIISIVPLEAGKLQAGARNLLIYAIDGSVFEAEETILEIGDGKLRANRSDENFESIWAVELSEVGSDQILVSVKQTRRPKKFYLKWQAPWLKWRDSLRLERALHNFSELITRTD